MSNFESIICNQIAHRNVRLIGVIRDRSNAFLGGNSVTNATQKFRSLDPSGHTAASACLSRHHPGRVSRLRATVADPARRLIAVHRPAAPDQRVGLTWPHSL